MSCSSDLTIKVWDTANQWTNTKTFHGHDHSVSSVRFLPGDDYIVSASRDRTIRIWELATGYCAKTLSGHSDWVRWVTPSSDGRLIASCGNDQTGRIWDRSSGETKVELRGHEHVVEAIAFAPVSAYEALRELSDAKPAAGKADQSPGLFVATGGRDKVIKIWETSSGQCLRTLVGHDNWIRGICWSPNGKFLLSCSDDKTIRVWDLKNGARCSKTVEAHGHFGEYRSESSHSDITSQLTVTISRPSRPSVTSITWARAKSDPGPRPDGQANGSSSSALPANGEAKTINAVATTSVDLSIKIWTP